MVTPAPRLEMARRGCDGSLFQATHSVSDLVGGVHGIGANAAILLTLCARVLPPVSASAPLQALAPVLARSCVYEYVYVAARSVYSTTFE